MAEQILENASIRDEDKESVARSVAESPALQAYASRSLVDVADSVLERRRDERRYEAELVMAIESLRSDVKVWGPPAQQSWVDQSNRLTDFQIDNGDIRIIFDTVYDVEPGAFVSSIKVMSKFEPLRESGAPGAIVSNKEFLRDMEEIAKNGEILLVKWAPGAREDGLKKALDELLGQPIPPGE